MGGRGCLAWDILDRKGGGLLVCEVYVVNLGRWVSGRHCGAQPWHSPRACEGLSPHLLCPQCH